jgi:4-diphosphocytidyl-2-C-methyl-D-erythritol kinase
MLSERHGDALIVWAPAKVNLFLEVLGKRADGYHEIATLMVAVSLYDALEFREQPGTQINLYCDQPGLATDRSNLVLCAAELLREQTDAARGAEIRLAKRIPLAAGLAGGSTDAAATLFGLNLLWDLRLSTAELARLAAKLGSDVPFFFSTPAAWCTGRGEQVQRVALGAPHWFVLACPPLGLRTAAVYAQVRVPEQPRSGTEILSAVDKGNTDRVGALLHNRLQEAAERLTPALGPLRTRLECLRPAGVAMSGSGTSWFALCRDQREALGLARALYSRPEEGMNSRVFIVRSCS